MCACAVSDILANSNTPNTRRSFPVLRHDGTKKVWFKHQVPRPGHATNTNTNLPGTTSASEPSTSQQQSSTTDKSTNKQKRRQKRNNNTQASKSSTINPSQPSQPSQPM